MEIKVVAKSRGREVARSVKYVKSYLTSFPKIVQRQSSPIRDLLCLLNYH